ncbi:MAG: DinB family protein [Gemmatimonadota bacterium]
MSVFTNPASGAREAADAYIAAVLELLGDRDPMEVLRATGPWLGSVVDGTDPSALRRLEAPGKWSVAHAIQHLADAEAVWAYRVRMVLAHDRAPLTGYDQDAFARAFHYEERDPRDALRVFQVMRDANLWLLERATPADMERVGVHAERGEERLPHMIALNAGHDLVHRRQIERIIAAVS